MKMTREEAIRDFREHWASLAISGSRNKTEFLRRHNYPPMVNDCSLCESTNADCDKCPIEWPETCSGVGGCMSSYYKQWAMCDTPEERKRLAALIRDLPEKKSKPEPRFKVGDKVVPVSKSVCGPLSASMSWKRARDKGQPFIYVTMVGPNIVCHEKPTLNNGDYFLESDLRPYVEPLKPKFKVGDIVTGNARSDKRYSGTNSKMKAKVIGTPQDGIIAVKILEHEEKYWNGCIFSALEEKYFDLVTDGPKPQKEYPKELQVEWVGGQPKLKVGDRVRVKSNGRVGTIKDIQDKWAPPIGVKFDEPIFNGHNFNDHLPKGKYGFYNEGQLELLPINYCPEDKTVTVQTITIEFKGPKTICTIENQFGTFKGRAKCHPTDQWNEKTGADLALERAVEKFNEYQPDA